MSLVPSLTEALFVSGARVVGRTRYCDQPARLVRRAGVVGGTKRVDLGKVLALSPDLVVAVREENAREDVEALRDAGVEVFVGEPRTVRGALSMLRELAPLAGVVEYDWIPRTERVVERLEGRGFAPGAKPRRVFAPIWKGPYMTPGGDTYASDVLRLAGGENVFADRDRYPEVTLEEVEGLRPEVVLLPSEPYEFSAVDLEELYSLNVPASREGRIHLIDGRHLTWYGPRMADSLAQLAALIGA